MTDNRQTPISLSARDLYKSFATSEDPQPVLRGVSLTLEPGESIALTGESGSGKSTLMHLLAALDAPDSGHILLGEQEIGALTDAGRAQVRRDSIGLVFQQFSLIPALDVSANLAFQARLSGRWDADWADHLAQALGLSDLLARYPEQLSGGQQQRVAIGRALAARPRILLADEPTGNLDEATADAVLALMLELGSQTGAGLLMVTHSERLASRLGRRLHLSGGRIA